MEGPLFQALRGTGGPWAPSARGEGGAVGRLWEEQGAPSRPWPAPTDWPSRLSVRDPESPVLFILPSPADLASSLWKDVATTSVLVAQWAPGCVSKDGLGAESKGGSGYGTRKFGSRPPAVQQTSDHLFVF